MKIEKLDRVATTVEHLDEAIKFFSDLLGITFDKLPSGKVAISPSGLELLEVGSTLPNLSLPAKNEGVYCFHFKVSDLEQAKAEMEKKGIRLLREINLGTLKELIYSPDDLHGITLVLVEYKTPKVIDAIWEEPS
jgi:predicted enzyme related to lactoylglutathione lyase